MQKGNNRVTKMWFTHSTYEMQTGFTVKAVSQNPNEAKTMRRQPAACNYLRPVPLTIAVLGVHYIAVVGHHEKIYETLPRKMLLPTEVLSRTIRLITKCNRKSIGNIA